MCTSLGCLDRIREPSTVVNERCRDVVPDPDLDGLEPDPEPEGKSCGLGGVFACEPCCVGVIPCRQCGQVSCSLNHIVTQPPWNQCLHGNSVTSLPNSTASMQMLHSALPSTPNIVLSTFLLGRASMAAADAGPGALEPAVCSISWVMMRS